MKLNELTIKEAQEGLSKKEFSSVELTKSFLERIANLETKLNAFITVCNKEALAQANQADREIKNTEDAFKKNPLKGIPIAIKDLYQTLGIKTTAASKVLENYVPVYDSTSVKRLKEKGAIIIGKTNCDAWAHGASGENSDFGPTKNPWNLERTPGGSSSGSAVAVAADECIFSLGTDTGGSIRFPASFCNVVGLKPTYGRVSRYGVIAMASSLDSMGHFTKNVKDSAIVLELTAGIDPNDATSSLQPVPKYSQNLEMGIKELRIGFPKEYFSEGMDPKVAEQTKKAIKVLEKLGAGIEEISLPHAKYALAAYYIIQPSEVSSNLARYDGIRYGDSRKSFGDEAKRRIMLGTYALSAGYYEAYYLKAMQVRTLIKADFDQAFKDIDLIITPVSPTPPFKLGEKVENPLQMYLVDIYTVTANLAGIPGLALPAGFVNDLPVGIQLLGPQFSEEKLFQVGYAYEQNADWRSKKPVI